MRARRPLHVAMVCPRYPPMVGGSEAHVYEVSRRLVDRGHRVEVITTAAESTMPGTADEEGIVVHRLPTLLSNSDLYIAPAIARQITRVGADVVHVQGYHTFTAPIAMSTASRLGTPYVVTFHSGGHSSRIRRAIRPLQRRALRGLLAGADALIGVSAFETDFFARRLDFDDDAIQTVPNGVAPEFVAVGDPPPTRHADAPLVVSFGRLEVYKGHDKVIRAFARQRPRLSAARLRVVGDGSQRDALESLTRQLRIDDRVEFVSVPFGDRAALAGELGAADVVVLMSSYESQGIAGYEALATGARLIVADGSALTELGSFPGVEVVPVHGGDDLADMLELQLARPALCTAPTVPTWDDTTDAVEAIYRRIVAEDPTAADGGDR